MTLQGAARTGACAWLLCTSLLAGAQEQEKEPRPRLHCTRYYPGKIWTVSGLATAGMAGSLVALDQAWYKGHDRTAFHLFNDGGEWHQVDKLGHTYSAYQLGRGGHAAFRWTGLNDRTSTWLGAAVGWTYLAGIEYLDGYSSAWGFSLWDMAANTAGSALFVGQQLAWQEQRVMLKWSAHLTHFAPQRPDVLGSTVPERLLKDYNGTTIWLSANPNSFGWKELPPWLNMAVGMGATGMLSARDNPDAYRRWFLSPDIAFSRIPTESKFLRTAFFLLDALKLPAPALELNGRGKVVGHLVYF